jgi:hypothetical protein
MRYNRCGASGLKLPAISLGLWHNFGHDRPLDSSRSIVRRAFDLGITHPVEHDAFDEFPEIAQAHKAQLVAKGWTPVQSQLSPEPIDARSLDAERGEQNDGPSERDDGQGPGDGAFFLFCLGIDRDACKHSCKRWADLTRSGLRRLAGFDIGLGLALASTAVDAGAMVGRAIASNCPESLGLRAYCGRSSQSVARQVISPQARWSMAR